ncbi:hypothetical protein V2G26_014183 [Clonostachys chloroleuca]
MKLRGFPLLRSCTFVQGVDIGHPNQPPHELDIPEDLSMKLSPVRAFTHEIPEGRPLDRPPVCSPALIPMGKVMPPARQKDTVLDMLLNFHSNWSVVYPLLSEYGREPLMR